MKIYWGGKPKPEPKEVINDEVLGTIKVFNNGLEFVDNFFPNYGGVEFKYVTENNVMIPAKIERAKGFDVAYEEFTTNRKQIIAYLRRIRSFEKLIMDEILRNAENDTIVLISNESDEFRNTLVSLTISVTINLEDAITAPDDAVVFSNVRVLSEGSGVNQSTEYFVSLSEGKIDSGASYTDPE